MRVTRPNLLAWYDTAVDNSLFPIQANDCRTGALVTYPGEDTWFYMNLITPFAEAPSSINPALIEFKSSSPAVSTTSSSISIDEFQDTGNACLYGRLTCPSVQPGLYQWRLIVDGVTYVSHLIEVMSEADARQCSVYIDFRHPKTIQGIRYPWIAGLHQSARVRMSSLQPTYPEEVTVYREYTTGQPIPYNQASDKVVPFSVPFTDAIMLEGINTMLLHETITFNGVPVRKRDAMSTTQLSRGNLSKAAFSVYDLSYAQSMI